MYKFEYSSDSVLYFRRGDKRYELSNHLGNVLAVVTDRRIQVCGLGEVIHYEAQIVRVSDYYPFGMQIKERNWNAGEYRFGFNGRENDNEIAGDGNYIDFDQRIYDSRLGKWLAVDPMRFEFPQFGPYSFAGNCPITFYDPNGTTIIIYYKDAQGKVQQYEYTPGVKPTVDNPFVNKVHEAVTYNMNTEKGTEVWNDLSESEGVIEIKEKECTTHTGTNAQGDPDSDYFDPNMSPTEEGQTRTIGTIYWDPNTEVLFSDDEDFPSTMGPTSPSTALLHESGHAVKFDQAQQNINDYGVIDYIHDAANGTDDDYGSEEERRNTTEVEHVYIREINAWEQLNAQNQKRQPSYQPIRYNHRAYFRYYNNNADVNLVDGSTYLEYKKNRLKFLKDFLKRENAQDIDDGIKIDDDEN